jgi:acetolactate synthase regulatory subunit
MVRRERVVEREALASEAVAATTTNAQEAAVEVAVASSRAQEGTLLLGL